jgi:uncharacterized protein
MKKLCALIWFVPVWLWGQGYVTQDLVLHNGAIELPGTLSYPDGPAAMPLAIFVHGSGNVDRNGNQGFFVQANYIQMMADSLNANGIAVYRYDKRTANPKNRAHLGGTLLRDFAMDVQVAIAHFKDDPTFGSIYLIGHSQGSLVAMLAINDHVDGLISIAGAGKSIDQILVEQVGRQDSTLGVRTQEHLTELMATDTIQKVNVNLIQLLAPQNQRFIKNWGGYRPTELIAALQLPILLLHGSMDGQVTMEEALALQRAQPNAQFKAIPNMNHVLKHLNDQQDDLKSYRDAHLGLSEMVIKEIVAFIRLHG